MEPTSPQPDRLSHCKLAVPALRDASQKGAARCCRASNTQSLTSGPSDTSSRLMRGATCSNEDATIGWVCETRATHVLQQRRTHEGASVSGVGDT